MEVDSKLTPLNSLIDRSYNENDLPVQIVTEPIPLDEHISIINDVHQDDETKLAVLKHTYCYLNEISNPSKDLTFLHQGLNRAMIVYHDNNAIQNEVKNIVIGLLKVKKFDMYRYSNKFIQLFITSQDDIQWYLDQHDFYIRSNMSLIIPKDPNTLSYYYKQILIWNDRHNKVFDEVALFERIFHLYVDNCGSLKYINFDHLVPVFEQLDHLTNEHYTLMLEYAFRNFNITHNDGLTLTNKLLDPCQSYKLREYIYKNATSINVLNNLIADDRFKHLVVIKSELDKFLQVAKFNNGDKKQITDILIHLNDESRIDVFTYLCEKLSKYINFEFLFFKLLSKHIGKSQDDYLDVCTRYMTASQIKKAYADFNKHLIEQNRIMANKHVNKAGM